MRAVSQWFGRVSMYGLLAGGLVLLAAWSWLGSVLRTIPQYSGDLLASLLVCVLVTLAANSVVSLVLRAPLRFSSSLITGLLLYFLMWPAASAKELGAAALAAVIAVASKFLLVPFGRRLVNPAAFGAFVVAVAGVGAPVWWVATGWMIVPVIIVGVAVLWRAGGWDAALVAGVVYLAGTTWWLMSSNGTGFGETLRSALVSYPILFFALFMVTEPLAAGASRWQRLVVAAVMGAVASRPLNLAVGEHSFTLGPEFALVVGNVVATVLAVAVASATGRGAGASRGLRVSSVERLSPSLVQVEFSSRRPVRYRAGQAIELTAPGGGVGARGNRRVFSLVTAAGEDPRTLSVIYRLPTRASKFKLRLAAASPGLKVRSEGIRGDFTLPGGASPVLMVARGVGITPFLAQVDELVTSGTHRDVVLVHVVGSPEDSVLTDRLVSRLGSERLTSAGIRIATLDTSSGERLDSSSLLKSCPDAQQRVSAVSGSPAFVASAHGVLRQAGLGRPRTDTFAGY